MDEIIQLNKIVDTLRKPEELTEELTKLLDKKKNCGI